MNRIEVSRLIFKLLAMFVLASLLLSGLGVGASSADKGGRPASAADRSSLQERCLGAGDLRTAKRAGSEALRFVGAGPGNAIAQPAPVAENASAEEAARAYMGACAAVFGIADASAELATMRSSTIGDGRSVVRFQQTHQGVPVMAGETIVMLDGQRNVLTVVNKFTPVDLADTSPAVDADLARQNAIQAVAKEYQLDEAALVATEPELWVYVPSLLNPMDTGPVALVWRLDVRSEQALINELVLVDAEQGSIALMFSQMKQVRALAPQPRSRPPKPEAGALPSSPQVLGTPLISIYTMNHATAPLPGTLVCTQANETDCNSDPDAQAAYLYVRRTYNYYASMFSRDSVDGAGLPLQASVHYGTGLPIASWTGDQLIFGDGFSQAEDVVGHELTHAVIDEESNLLTYYQSGAINESLSDIFGEFIEKTNQGDTDWQIGEGLAIGAVRDMADPTIYSDPNSMSSAWFYTSASDYGGIHHNSGINNKAAYLMTDGGSFDGYTVTGLGAAKVARIYYEANANLLTTGSDYFDLYYALNQACLLSAGGTEGIVPADCEEVRNAANAVQMTAQPSMAPTYNTHAPLCTAPMAPVNLFFDDLESFTGNWVYGYSVGPNRWAQDMGYAHSGVRSLHGTDTPSAAVYAYARMNIDVALPTNAYLHFYHAYGFYDSGAATYHDGGVVEYSTDGGDTWNAAGWLMDCIDCNGYNGTIAFPTANPLTGQNAFVGDSHGYYSTRLNLDPLNGQSVRFRWRMGLQGVASDMGWFVDDVRIYTCGHQFADVPTAGKEWMEPWVVTFYEKGITTGCGSSPLTYCPENPVTRAAMAVFILRALHGTGYTPPAASHFFSDMPVAGKEWMEPWVDEFYREGLTTGCASGPLRYCPESSVTRAAMAVFLLRTLEGSSYVPPAASHFFTDLPVVGKEWMEPFVDEFYRRKITSGCATDPVRYCPEDAVTRAAMAVFIGRAFGLYP